MAKRTGSFTKNGIQVNLIGDTETRKAIETLEKSIEKSMSKAIGVGATTVVNAARKLAPVSLGNLANSIMHEIEVSVDKQVTAIVGPTRDIIYGKYVEYGTGIYAVSGMGRQTAWTYYNEKLGRWVHTVGNKPQPYLFPALQKSRKRIESLIAAAVKQELAKTAKDWGSLTT